MPALPGVLGLELKRHYNSLYSLPNVPPGLMGRGWKLSYETQLYVQGSTVQIVQADGERLVFNKGIANPSLCSSPDPLRGEVRIDNAGGSPQSTRYTWRWPDGRELLFGANGQLLQITAPTGEFVSLQYDPQGWLIRVRDPQGRELRLNYLAKSAIQADREGSAYRGVQSIDTPVGRFEYGYGPSPASTPEGQAASQTANLSRVSIPTHHEAGKRLHPWANQGPSASSITRHYHHEDPRFPTLLTGISVQGTGSDGQPMSQRLVTWGYDRNARANLSVKGQPAQLATGANGQPLTPARLKAGTGIEQVTLTSPAPGITILANALGQTTTYRHGLIAGQKRLLESRGAGCATCGPANMRYSYNAQGQLTEQTQLSLSGQSIEGQRSSMDALGRIVKLERIAYINGKAQAPQLQVRYSYLDERHPTQPTLIARPSVIAGKEHQTQITYNAAGQVTQETQSGWSPLDSQGQVATTSDAATPISRSTAYSYRTLNGRSVLSQIDGPLPNGPQGTPQDSDITALTYDAAGDHITALAEPGGMSSILRYDSAGRIVKVQNAQGFWTAFSYAADQLVQTSSSGPGWAQPTSQRFKYSAAGHLSETGTETGRQTNTETGAETNAEAASNANTANNPQSASYRAQSAWGIDSAGRALWTASAQGVLQQNTYDAESRLIDSGRYQGSIAQRSRYTYDAQGRISSITDPLGRVVTGQRAAKAQSQAIGTSQLVDDFGRTVATRSPDSGWSRQTFDQADRLIASLDAQGNQAQYDYNAMGRITRQTITDASTKQASTTTWAYSAS